MQIFAGSAAGQIIRNLFDGLLPHAAHQQIGAAFGQNGRENLIFPIIIVGKTAQTGFDASDNDRQFRPDFLYFFCIDCGSVIRAFPHRFTR